MCPRCSSASPTLNGSGNGAVSISAALKTCKSCGEAKPTSAYLPSRYYAGGYTDRCKPCVWKDSEAERAHREKQLAAYRERKATNRPPPPKTAKTCRTCRVTKPAANFARHHWSKDGLRHDCKSCCERKRTHAPDELAAARERRLARNNRETREWKARNREKVLAQHRLSYAVKVGKIARSPCCQIDGCDATTVQGHHHSYDRDKTLDVLWVCPKHHRQIHAGRDLSLRAGVPLHLAGIPANERNETSWPTTSPNARTRRPSNSSPSTSRRPPTGSRASSI